MTAEFAHAAKVYGHFEHALFAAADRAQHALSEAQAERYEMFEMLNDGLAARGLRRAGVQLARQ